MKARIMLFGKTHNYLYFKALFNELIKTKLSFINQIYIYTVLLFNTMGVCSISLFYCLQVIKYYSLLEFRKGILACNTEAD